MVQADIEFAFVQGPNRHTGEVDGQGWDVGIRRRIKIHHRLASGIEYSRRDDVAIDAWRLGAMLKRIRGQILHQALDTVSPLAVPVLLEIGRESVSGEGHDALLAEAANDLIDEAMRLV